MSLLLVPVLISAFYCLMVCTCIVGRMSKETRHVTRWPVVSIGAMAAWAILRTLEGAWSPDLPAAAHATVLIVAALVLALRPRIQT